MGKTYFFEVTVSDYNGDLSGADEIKTLLEQCKYLEFVTAIPTGEDEIDED